MTDVETTNSHADLLATPELATTGLVASEDLDPGSKRYETLYFAFRNTKLVVGLTVVLLLLVVAIVGPWLTDADPFEGLSQSFFRPAEFIEHKR